ncbi:MAG: acyltransferase [Saprospiraceae bacterium]|nr:acyltransferase [Saprospiraceae bacterium]MBK9222143.1 acyltransferase [Saprospiraceae bacterium]
MSKFFRMLFGLFHFIGLKLFNSYRFHSRKLSFFSFRSSVIFEKSGQFILNGKLILSPFSELRVLGNLTIGNNVFINKYSRIVAHHNIEIGNNVLIAQFVSILDHDHAYTLVSSELKMKGYNTAPIKIGNNVWIGDKVTILKGTTIGDNVIIGANVLLKGTIESNCMVVYNNNNNNLHIKLTESL